MMKTLLSAAALLGMASGGAMAACDGTKSSLFPSPDFDQGASKIDGDNLLLVVHASNHYERIKLDIGPDASCVYDIDGATLESGSAWIKTAHASEDGTNGCASTYTYSVNLADTTRLCTFDKIDTTDTTTWQQTLEMTTRDDNGQVFGDVQTRTDVTATTFQITMDLTESVSNIAEDDVTVFGPAIAVDAVTTQTVNNAAAQVTATVTVVTSVQWPYILSAPEAGTSGTNGDTTTNWNINYAGATVTNVGCDVSTSDCRQTWVFPIVVEGAAEPCSLDGTFYTDFTIGCDAAFTASGAGSCDTPNPDTVEDISFTLNSENFCPQVVEVASVTADVKLYDSEDSRNNALAEASEFILGTTVFGRVNYAAEGNVDIATVQPTLLEVQNICDPACTNAGITFIDSTPGVNDASTKHGFSASALEGGTTSEAFFKFQYDLDTTTVRFSADATTGAANQRVVAEFTIVYTDPASQKLVHKLVRVPVSLAAGTPVVVGGSAELGVVRQASSSSNSSSSIAGVSQATVVAVGVALGAVAMIAVGAAVTVRRRAAAASSKSDTARKMAQSSSTNNLELTGAAAPAQSPDVPTGDLRTVQSAYNASV